MCENSQNNKNMSKSNHYIDNEKFTAAIIEHRNKYLEAKKHNKPKPQLSNYIGQCFIDMSNNMIRKMSFGKGLNFIDYTFKDECVEDAIENCLRYAHKYNPEAISKRTGEQIQSGAFAYFSQIIYFAYIRRIYKENTQLYVKYKMAENIAILSEDEILELEEFELGDTILFDNISEFIEKYETRMKETKAKLKKKEVLSDIDKFILEENDD